MAGYLDVTIDSGATFNNAVTLTDVNGNLLNLSNVVLNAQVKKSFITSNVAANMVITIANTASGQIYLGLDALSTSNLANWPSKYYYDVVMTNTSTNVSQRVLQGILYVNPGISFTPNAV